MDIFTLLRTNVPHRIVYEKMNVRNLCGGSMDASGDEN